MLSTTSLGGAERSAIELVGSARRHGHDFSVISYRGGDGDGVELAVRDGVPITVARSKVNLIWLLRESRPDAIWVFGLRLSLLMRTDLVRLAVRGDAGLRPVVLSAQRGLDPWRTWAHNFVDRVTQTRVDRYLANSEAAARMLTDDVGIQASRVVVQTRGLSANWLSRRPTPPAAPPVRIMVAGSGRTEKGHELLLPVLRALPTELDWVATIFTTRGPAVASLRRQLSTSGMMRRVTVVEGHTLEPSDYDQHHVLLHPSHSESMPRVVLEAAARALMVVATDVGDTKVIVGASGWVVVPNDPSALSAALALALRATLSGRRLGCETPALAARRHQDDVALELIGLVQGTLDAGFPAQGKPKTPTNRSLRRLATPDPKKSSTDRSKVALSTDSFFPYEGGGERQLRLVLDIVADRGWEAVVIARRLGPWPRRESVGRLEVQRVAYGRPTSQSFKVAYVAAAAIRLVIARPEVIIGLQLGASTAAAALAATALRRPFVIRLTGGTSQGGSELAARGMNPAARIVTGIMLRRASRVVAPARHLLDDSGAFRKLVARKGCVIANGVALDEPCEPEQVRPDEVIWIGREDPVKGFGDLIALAGQFPHLRFIVVGPMDASSGSSQPNIDFVGWTTDPMARLRGAGAMVVTSRFEGSPNVVLEALAAGTPVVGYEIAGNKEVAAFFDEGIVLVPLADLTALAQALEWVLKRGVRARGTPQSLDDVADEWATLLSEVR